MTRLQKALKHSLMPTNYKLAYSALDSAGTEGGQPWFDWCGL